MGGLCQKSNVENTISIKVSSNSLARKQTCQLFKEKLDLFTFYTKINKENIFLLIDDIETNLFMDLNSKEYSIVKEKWRNIIMAEKKQSLNINGNVVIHETKVNNPYCINNEFSSQIFNFLEKFLKKDRINFIKLLSQGPPNEFRWFSWLSIAFTQNDFKLLNHNDYKQILKENLNDEITLQIQKDSHRSAPNILYFQNPNNLESIFNILKSYALLDEEIGYCQGMNILVAHLLLVADGNEINAFNMLRYLFLMKNTVNLREFYLQGFPKLGMYVYLLKEIIKEQLPEIYKKIKELDVQDELWLYKWLQSLFILVLPFSVVIRLWDCIFAFGLEFILNYSIAFLTYCEKGILRSNDIIDFLDCFQINFKDNLEIIKFRDKIISNAKKIHLSETHLVKLKMKYEKYDSDKKSNIIKDLTKSHGNSTTNVDTRTNAYFDGKNEILKFQENMRYISEVNSNDENSDFENDLDQIRFEWEVKESKNNSQIINNPNIPGNNINSVDVIDSDRNSNLARYNIQAVTQLEKK